ncbi:MAG: nucleotidyltransferase domain-containing protein [Candidatus Electrothrix sp. AX5]|jgi:predicted nucleotidyltransferase|uniref:Nucleotidyltransferase domain-containing protein n=1 Tax=Candidatus Electrothrix aarhusensis TaxID=1859131 RepID=A0A444J5G1_9BACT|nr:nucleotidyltransferase domain-containing protein [Candidatus Electrothrix sp. AX5]RWX48318.1 Nucleotidyltransferase domain-containing protein [Candidatus Electrothrix aarhusensis]
MKPVLQGENNSPHALRFLHQVREEVHRLVPDAKVILHGSRVRNEARQDSDWDFLIIADHPLEKKMITKLKDSLYDVELENDEVVSSIIRSSQEWSSPEYDALPFKKAVEKEGVEL